jgi:hypothetical protein
VALPASRTLCDPRLDDVAAVLGMPLQAHLVQPPLLPPDLHARTEGRAELAALPTASAQRHSWFISPAERMVVLPHCMQHGPPTGLFQKERPGGEQARA